MKSTGLAETTDDIRTNALIHYGLSCAATDTDARTWLDLFGSAPKVQLLEAPRFEAKYYYSCEDTACRGHKQGLLDWELVALERRLKHLDDAAAIGELRKKFFEEMCAPDRGPMFFVGNQLKYPLAFSVLGVYRSR